ncbi:MAG: ABC transporter permease [Lachnospiraceae bacterium]
MNSFFRAAGRIQKRMPTLLPGILLILLIALPGSVFKFLLDMELTQPNGTIMNLAPCTEHILGTQSEGKDICTMIVLGSWITLKIGLIAGAIGVGFGTMFGLIAGYFGGKTDTCISTIVDIGMTIPPLAIMILIAASIQNISIAGMGVIVSITAWMQPTRIIRSQMLSLKERNYVQLARISNVGNLEIIFREIMPNLLPFLASTFVNAVSTAILSSIGLEVLGLGPSGSMSLGSIIYFATYYSAMWRGMWWWWLPPIVVIILIFVALFLISLALDALGNPKLNRM